jgi:hypothetical protein
LGAATTSPYNHFWQYLSNSPIYNTATGEILGLSAGVFYTIFAPNNAAILQAVRDGFLPGSIVNGVPVPNFKPTLPLQIEQVVRFLQYHILNKVSVATDGEGSGAYETLLKNANSETTTIFVNNTALNAMSLTDMFSRTGTITLNESNYLSNRIVIHLVNNYLQYKY